jgi:hypothetical protein
MRALRGFSLDRSELCSFGSIPASPRGPVDVIWHNLRSQLHRSHSVPAENRSPIERCSTQISPENVWTKA